MNLNLKLLFSFNFAGDCSLIKCISIGWDEVGSFLLKLYYNFCGSKKFPNTGKKADVNPFRYI